jgi:hypothetical protein
MKFFLPLIFHLSFAYCSSLFVGPKPVGNPVKLGIYDLQLRYEELSPETKIGLAVDFANILYDNFQSLRKTFSSQSPTGENLVFYTLGLSELIDLQSQKDGLFNLFMKQPSGFGKTNILEFAKCEPSLFHSDYQKSDHLKGLNDQTFLERSEKPLNDMVMISYSLFYLRTVVIDGLKFHKFPKVYSQIALLFTLCKDYPTVFGRYKDLLSIFFTMKQCAYISGIEFPMNSRMRDAAMILKLGSNSSLFSVENFTSKFIRVPNSAIKTKLQLIAPSEGMGEPTLILSSHRKYIDLYVLEFNYQFFFTQFKVEQLGIENDDNLMLSHGRHFKFPWIPGSYIIVALNREESWSKELEWEFKTVIEMVRRNSPFLLIYLFNNNLSLYRIPPS